MVMVDTAKQWYRSTRLFYRLSTNQLRLLPDFIIIGTQRGGTTSLYYYLTEHPGIARALMKEVHFFDDHYSEGLSWYRAQFPSSLHKYYTEQVRKEHFITGESSPYYLFYPHAPGRISQVVPGAKLIVLLRNPIDRAYSHHWLVTLEGKETLAFAQAIEQETERLAGEHKKIVADERYASFNHRHFSYLARGIYVDQLQHWMQYYPRAQFLILKSEDFYKDTANILHQTLDFLGVETVQQPGGNNPQREFKHYREPHKTGYTNETKPPSMDPGVRAYLQDYFKPHNSRLYEFLGQDFGWDT
ncbi:MAG TPA: sulfotransferase domain-containing protein [Ktedonobacteraceae bacterium]|nr:sulfotransferase domain-containing protein [Ktedonobacteraceae bacterium]